MLGFLTLAISFTVNSGVNAIALAPRPRLIQRSTVAQAPPNTATRLTNIETCLTDIQASLTRMEGKVDKIENWQVSASCTSPVSFVLAGSMISILSEGNKALTTAQLCNIGAGTTAFAIAFFVGLQKALSYASKKTP